MKTKFICFANSYKEGGRCIAGIELDENNNPRVLNGRPQWIRPVCNTLHGEIPTELVSNLNLLDIVEIDVTEKQKINYQSENTFFKQDSIHIAGKFNKESLAMLCDEMKLIFGNHGKAVSQENITQLDHSLLLLKTEEFEVIEQTFEDSFKIQPRLDFVYNDVEYDFPITDPAFLDKYKINPNFWDKYTEAYLCVSLGIAWKDWYYKLVAGIIL